MVHHPESQPSIVLPFLCTGTLLIGAAAPRGRLMLEPSPLFYKFSLYFSLSFYLSLLFFYFFYIFSPYLVPALLALLTPGFPIFHYSSISLLEETSLLLILSYWWTPPQQEWCFANSSKQLKPQPQQPSKKLGCYPFGYLVTRVIWFYTHSV